VKFNKILVVPLLLGLTSLTWYAKEVTFAEEPTASDKPPEHVLCYAPQYIPPTVEDIDNSLQLLENQYEEGKISKETYDVRKKSLLNQRKDAENKGDLDEN